MCLFTRLGPDVPSKIRGSGSGYSDSVLGEELHKLRVVVSQCVVLGFDDIELRVQVFVPVLKHIVLIFEGGDVGAELVAELFCSHLGVFIPAFLRGHDCCRVVGSIRWGVLVKVWSMQKWLMAYKATIATQLLRQSWYCVLTW